MQTSSKTELYDLLVTRDFEPEILDSMGKAVDTPENAELFSFDWKTENKNYGTVVILLGEDQDLQIFFGDNLGRTMEGDDKADWYEFLNQLKQFATRNMLSFDIKNLNRLKYTMQGMSAIKEGLFEGYYGNRKVSYSDQPKKTRLVIKHSRPLDEGEKRYRCIESLFIETEQGERFKLPFTKLVGGRAMARHVAEGGTPYDAFGQHICEMIAEMNTMAKFVRAAKNKQFEGEAADMVSEAVRHYTDLKAKVKKIIGQRGYHEERETFDPAAISDSSSVAESIRNMFVEQTLDARIEEAIPILAKIKKQSSMKEADEFESWADTVTEGTWALPDSDASKEKLSALMAQELPVGPDATDITNQLYDILGDDKLFDQLEDLASRDPSADARPIIQQRMNQLGVELPEPTQENLDVDGVMMTRPSNMSSESVDRATSLSRLLELSKWRHK